MIIESRGRACQDWSSCWLADNRGSRLATLAHDVRASCKFDPASSAAPPGLRARVHDGSGALGHRPRLGYEYNNTPYTCMPARATSLHCTVTCRMYAPTAGGRTYQYIRRPTIISTYTKY